ncbi:hypothetical protein N9562_00290 [Flavobacteriaceae bacterium]|nr:hypothetical protein [Flavobacteriaceae bacterium]
MNKRNVKSKSFVNRRVREIETAQNTKFLKSRAKVLKAIEVAKELQEVKTEEDKLWGEEVKRRAKNRELNDKLNKNK